MRNKHVFEANLWKAASDAERGLVREHDATFAPREGGGGSRGLSARRSPRCSTFAAVSCVATRTFLARPFLSELLPCRLRSPPSALRCAPSESAPFVCAALRSVGVGAIRQRCAALRRSRRHSRRNRASNVGGHHGPRASAASYNCCWRGAPGYLVAAATVRLCDAGGVGVFGPRAASFSAGLSSRTGRLAPVASAESQCSSVASLRRRTAMY